MRVDYRGAAIGISTEDIFWGPGIRQALLFDANAAGFPHMFLGTSHAIATPVGRFYAQLLYGRLEESRWAPPNGSSSRFGAGGIAVWMPPSQPIEIGVARFYHQPWPKSLTLRDLTVPFGSLFNDREVQGVGVPENQLLSVFATIRVPASGFELFGEFGKNDRNADLRDVLAEPEHNSAWMLGMFKVIGPSSLANGFWTVRIEVGNGRVPSSRTSAADNQRSMIIQLSRRDIRNRGSCSGRPWSTDPEESTRPSTDGRSKAGLAFRSSSDKCPAISLSAFRRRRRVAVGRWIQRHLVSRQVRRDVCDRPRVGSRPASQHRRRKLLPPAGATRRIAMTLRPVDRAGPPAASQPSHDPVNVAIVHDWLTTLGGGGLVLRELLRVYPDAPVFTLIDRLAAGDRRFLGVGASRRRCSMRFPVSAGATDRCFRCFRVR